MTKKESNKVYNDLNAIDRLQYSLLNAIRSKASADKINKAYEKLQDLIWRLREEYKRV